MLKPNLTQLTTTNQQLADSAKATAAGLRRKRELTAAQQNACKQRGRSFAALARVSGTGGPPKGGQRLPSTAGEPGRPAPTVGEQIRPAQAGRGNNGGTLEEARPSWTSLRGGD
ncbi:hypothetical protein ACW185_04895 [Limosilactobacillus fermentum]